MRAQTQPSPRITLRVHARPKRSASLTPTTKSKNKSYIMYFRRIVSLNFKRNIDVFEFLPNLSVHCWNVPSSWILILINFKPCRVQESFAILFFHFSLKIQKKWNFATNTKISLAQRQVDLQFFRAIKRNVHQGEDRYLARKVCN